MMEILIWFALAAATCSAAAAGAAYLCAAKARKELERVAAEMSERQWNAVAVHNALMRDVNELAGLAGWRRVTWAPPTAQWERKL